MSGLRSTYLVALREATERARGRAYIVSTLATLILLGAVIAVVVFTESGPTDYTVGLAGDTPDALTASIDAVATASNVLVHETRYPDEDSARRAVADGDIDAAIIGDGRVLVERANGSSIEAILTTALRQARLLQSLESLGVDPAQLADSAAISVVAVAAPGEGEGEGIAVAAIVLLFLVITTYGQWVLLGVVEEKSTHVVEQVVSSTSVRSLLAGKVIGIGLLGIAQLLLLIAVGIGAGAVFDLFALPSATYATAFWSIAWFLLGFAFYAVLYAAGASLVSRPEDAQAAAMPVALFGIASYLATLAIVAPHPESTLARIISLLPPVAPIAFPARIATDSVSVWELSLGVGLTVVAVVAVIRLAARIYAGAILSAGARMKPLQAWRASGELAHR